MTAAKPTSSFPIKKISFPHQRSIAEKSFVRSHASNSESLRLLEEQKEDARLAAKEAARRAARFHGDLLGEAVLNKKGAKMKKQSRRWRKKLDVSKKSKYPLVDSADIIRPSPQPSLQEDEEDLSLTMGWTPSSNTAALTAPAEDASKSTHSKNSSPRKLLIKKFNSKHSDSKMPQSNDITQLANHLSASGAYACGICGTIYDSLANATKHEDKCLIEWVEMMERKNDDASTRKFLEFPVQYRPHEVSNGHNNIPRRGLQRANGASVSSLSSSRHSSALSNRPKYQRSSLAIEFTPPKTGGEVDLPSQELQKCMLMTDEATVDIVRRSKYVLHAQCLKELAALGDSPEDQERKKALMLKKREFEAQQEMALLSRDRRYYGMVEQKSLEKIYGPFPKHENPYKYYYNRQYARMGVEIGSANRRGSDEDASSLLPKKTWNSIKHRFEHAYELIKEGPVSDMDEMDLTKKSKDGKNAKSKGDIKHGKNTLYVNVVVKNSVQVVNNELERMARGWWQSETSGDKAQNKEKVLDFQFEWIRAHTQKKVIQLAAVALASDFTPRKVAVQLSNDLYRLMGPQLQIRGVDIQTEIEYRSGQYFVLAVNIIDIDWILLFDHTAKHLAREQKRWMKEQKLRAQRRSSIVAPPKDTPKRRRRTLRELVLAARMRFPSRNEVVAQFLAALNRLHFVISLPLANVLYFLFCKYMVDKYILTVVTDDIFRYVEKKGMEMQLEIKGEAKQASFMLTALRELKEDDKKRKEKADEGDEGDGVRAILGPLLGALVNEDAADTKLPVGFDPPAALEFVAFEVDLPVGFLRLRRALLHTDSTFWKDAFFTDIMKYDNISDGKWSTNEKEIGLPKTPDSVDEAGFVNATLDFQYLMPKSAFVKANTCYATHEITYYDEHCFVIKEKTLTPEVPYGNTFVAWTQYSVVNTGKNTCRMVCSVEAEFPNGPPMVARQIKSGMRSGTSEKFVLLGETICRYADAVP